jgi:hypothetical protein
VTDSDPQLIVLFSEQIAPDRDEAFAARVSADVRRARTVANMALVGRLALGLAALAGAAFASSTIVSLFQPLIDWIASTGEILSVPTPVVALAACGVTLMTLYRRGWRLI